MIFIFIFAADFINGSATRKETGIDEQIFCQYMVMAWRIFPEGDPICITGIINTTAAGVPRGFLFQVTIIDRLHGLHISLYQLVEAACRFMALLMP
jgi:hypothetical protein